MDTYQPTPKSVSQHNVPPWFHDAKLGIFIHWGPYAVPGWATQTQALHEVVKQQDDAYWFAHTPYAEWYCQTMQIEGSPTQHYHAQTYGSDVPYDAFVPQFNKAIQAWEPDAWAELFRRAGARYVVLTSKHHDGFLLWPSATPNPHKPGWMATRDIVGELSSAVRAQEMRMGLYYSGGLDFTFKDVVIHDFADMMAAIPNDTTYATYADAHWRELITRYAPSVLWNDIGYPAPSDLSALFADYYNAVPDGLVNDRFTQINLPALSGPSSWAFKLMRNPIRWVVRRALTHPQGLFAKLQTSNSHCDFRTPEYTTYHQVAEKKWEATRGIGKSFGYNRNEQAEDLISTDALIHLLVDIVSKNGNLLLNVGPMADGTIPSAQRERLEALGAWLDSNGEAIFDTRPWIKAEGKTTSGLPLRFTQKDNVVYVLILGEPEPPQVNIASLPVGGINEVRLLGYGAPLRWHRQGSELQITLPKNPPASAAYAFKLTLS